MTEEKVMEEKTREKGELWDKYGSVRLTLPFLSQILLGGMWTTAAIPPFLYACIYQQAVVAGLDVDLICIILRQQILAYAMDVCIVASGRAASRPAWPQ